MRTLFALFVLALISISLSGCATHKAWVNPDVSQDETEERLSADEKYCQSRSDQASGGDSGIKHGMYTGCMVSKGWHRRQ